MIGTSRETVSRALVDLKGAGLVAIERRCVRILDSAALEIELRNSATCFVNQHECRSTADTVALGRRTVMTY